MRLASDDSLVASMDLGPSFFKKDHPKFRAIAFRKARPGIFSRIAWDEIIDYDSLSLTIYAHVNAIHTLCVDFVSGKKFPNPLRVLCQHTQDT